MITEQMLTDVGLLIDGKWDCLEGCGACCKVIGCKLLTKELLCPIYDDRPALCRSENTKVTDFQRAKACFGLIELLAKGVRGNDNK